MPLKRVCLFRVEYCRRVKVRAPVRQAFRTNSRLGIDTRPQRTVESTAALAEKWPVEAIGKQNRGRRRITFKAKVESTVQSRFQNRFRPASITPFPG